MSNVSLFVALVALQSHTPQAKTYTPPASILKDGWEVVRGLPLYVRPRDRGAKLLLSEPRQGFALRYVGGNGRDYFQTSGVSETGKETTKIVVGGRSYVGHTLHQRNDAIGRYEYRARGLFRDGSVRPLAVGSWIPNDEIRGLLAVFAQRRRR